MKIRTHQDIIYDGQVIPANTELTESDTSMSLSSCVERGWACEVDESAPPASESASESSDVPSDESDDPVADEPVAEAVSEPAVEAVPEPAPKPKRSAKK